MSAIRPSMSDATVTSVPSRKPEAWMVPDELALAPALVSPETAGNALQAVTTIDTAARRVNTTIDLCALVLHTSLSSQFPSVRIVAWAYVPGLSTWSGLGCSRRRRRPTRRAPAVSGRCAACTRRCWRWRPPDRRRWYPARCRRAPPRLADAGRAPTRPGGRRRSASRHRGCRASARWSPARPTRRRGG